MNRTDILRIEPSGRKIVFDYGEEIVMETSPAMDSRKRRSGSSDIGARRTRG